MRRALFILFSILQLLCVAEAQDLNRFIILDTIEVINGSFEERGMEIQAFPKNWFDCGDFSETAPSIFTNSSPFLQEGEAAQHGDVFLNLVTRENSTWEAIAQPLNRTLEAGENYVIKVFLRTSHIDAGKEKAGDNSIISPPVLLAINSIREIKQLGIDRNNVIEELAKSDLVVEEEWTEHTFVFQPKKEVSIIMLEAFYEVPVLSPYNGHLFIDNISHIYQVE